MFQLISDGGCDFTKEEVQKHNIDIIPFYVMLDGNTYLKEGVDITKDEYFKRLKEDKNLFPKTAQPNPQDYVDIYTPHLKAGKDIISLTISSKFSGTYNSATLAASMVKEDYPDRTIIVIDSLNCAIGQGLILKEMIKMRDKGFSITKTAELAEEIIKTVKIYFSLDTLEYLKKGGRVGPTTALVGGLLGLRPILHIVDGAVEQLDSVRGKDRVLALIEEGIVAALKDEVQNINLSVGHILREEDAVNFKASLEKSLGTKIENPVVEVGATIGTHAGPGALAIAYCKKYETFVK
ncbi:MAG: DegV family protein [Defluviitaleaceae bacterium]|nr:DegV family protein [Defluviitaleaceae bacterium]